MGSTTSSSFICFPSPETIRTRWGLPHDEAPQARSCFKRNKIYAILMSFKNQNKSSTELVNDLSTSIPVEYWSHPLPVLLAQLKDTMQSMPSCLYQRVDEAIKTIPVEMQSTVAMLQNNNHDKTQDNDTKIGTTKACSYFEGTPDEIIARVLSFFEVHEVSYIGNVCQKFAALFFDKKCERQGEYEFTIWPDTERDDTSAEWARRLPTNKKIYDKLVLDIKQRQRFVRFKFINSFNNNVCGVPEDGLDSYKSRFKQMCEFFGHLQYWRAIDEFEIALPEEWLVFRAPSWILPAFVWYVIPGVLYNTWAHSYTTEKTQAKTDITPNKKQDTNADTDNTLEISDLHVCKRTRNLAAHGPQHSDAACECCADISQFPKHLHCSIHIFKIKSPCGTVYTRRLHGASTGCLCLDSQPSTRCCDSFVCPLAKEYHFATADLIVKAGFQHQLMLCVDSVDADTHSGAENAYLPRLWFLQMLSVSKAELKRKPWIERLLTGAELTKTPPQGSVYDCETYGDGKRKCSSIQKYVRFFRSTNDNVHFEANVNQPTLTPTIIQTAM